MVPPTPREPGQTSESRVNDVARYWLGVVVKNMRHTRNEDTNRCVESNLVSRPHPYVGAGEVAQRGDADQVRVHTAMVQPRQRLFTELGMIQPPFAIRDYCTY